MFVVDSCVFVKIFIEEQDSSVARDFLYFLLKNDISFYVPDIFQYEILQVALKKAIDPYQVQKLLYTYKQSVLHMFIPENSTWDKAFEIIQSFENKQGIPAIYDAMYHAYAIKNNLYFITSDTKHINKTSHHGNIIELKDWKKYI